MTLDKTIELVRQNAGVFHKFIFHGSRNQNEEFYGRITSMYPVVFLITLDNGQVRSYSYSDLLISNLEMVD